MLLPSPKTDTWAGSSWGRPAVIGAVNRLQALVSAPGIGETLAKSPSNTRDTLGRLRARALEHYGGLDDVLTLVHDVRSLVLKARASQLLGLFQAEWHVHPYQWRVGVGAVLRGLSYSRLTSLCARALAIAGESPNLDGVIWLIAERDPSCRAELIRLGQYLGDETPAAALLRNIQRLHTPQECVCTGLKVCGPNQVAWVSEPNNLGVTV
jgi:hypothetical protein